MGRSLGGCKPWLLGRYGGGGCLGPGVRRIEVWGRGIASLEHQAEG